MRKQFSCGCVRIVRNGVLRGWHHACHNHFLAALRRRIPDQDEEEVK